uniref:Uncharacterized protein DKFZp459O037 n=1 Tax=Pongo abelii TaxID=9601 RepID=Q5RCQ4_PONAB|nr:hypothetical protein [Pongo abelii]
MFHQANSKDLFRLCSLDPKMSSVVWLTNGISLENMQKGISAIHERFGLGQRTNSSFQNRGLLVCLTSSRHPISPCPCLQWKLM